MIKKKYFIPIIVIISAILIGQIRLDRMCYYEFFVLRGFTQEYCHKICDIPFDMSPRKVIKTFTPKHTRIEGLEADCPLGYVPKIQTKAKNTNETLKKPNIILILLDDQDELVSPYLDEMPFVKELLFKNGTHFTHTFSPSPICCPARCQLLTGLYGHNNGVLTNSGKYGGYKAFTKPYNQNGTRLKDKDGRCINNENRFLPSMLQQHGYETQATGKYINQFESYDNEFVPEGWSDFRVGIDQKLYGGQDYKLMEWAKGDKEAKIVHYGMSEQDYSTDVILEKGIEFLQRIYQQDVAESESKNTSISHTPKFMYVCVTAPHLPLLPAKRHESKRAYWRSRFQSTVMNRESYNEQDISDKTNWLNDRYNGFTNFLKENVLQHIQFTKFNFTRWNEIEFEKRMSSLAAVDELVQALHKQITEQGEIDNTIFIFTSDNGYNMGSHRLLNKMAPYDESIRIPLAISGPGFKQGHKVSDFAKLQDLAPTILEAAGIQIPDYIDGLPLTPTPTPTPKPDVILQYAARGNGEVFKETVDGIYQEIPHEWMTIFPWEVLKDIPPFIGIRTKKYMFVKLSYYGHENQVELYDMENDPHQLENICRISNEKTSEKCRNILSELEPYLERMRVCSGKTCQQKN